MPKLMYTFTQCESHLQQKILTKKSKCIWTNSKSPFISRARRLILRETDDQVYRGELVTLRQHLSLKDDLFSWGSNDLSNKRLREDRRESDCLGVFGCLL